MNKPFYINVEKIYRSNKIAYSFIDGTGAKQRKVDNTFEPSLFTLNKHSNNVFTCGTKPNICGTNLKTLQGVPLVKQAYTMQDFGRTLNAIRNNFLETTEYHGNIDAPVQFMYNKFHNQGEPNLTKIRTAFLDIETSSINGIPNPDNPIDNIRSISLMDSNTRTMYAWGMMDYDRTKNEIMPPDADIIYLKCKNEEELLLSFLKIYKNLDFDNLTGWYTNQFDLPYLYNRIKGVFDEKTANQLSPYGSVWYKNGFNKNEVAFPLKITGVANLDYLELYKKYMYGSRESYKLDFIADLELGTTKIDYSEYHNLDDLYENNHQKYIEYNIYDTYLVYLMEQKLGLINLAMTIAYTVGCNFMDIFSPVRTWDVFIYNYLTERGICIPPKPHINMGHISYSGGHVKDPVRGLHDWIVTYDLNSLYPMIQLGCNISPETILDRNTDVQRMKNGLDKMFFGATDFDMSKIQSANGWCYNKNKVGFIPKMLNMLYEDRVAVKSEMLQIQQRVINIASEISRRGLEI